MWKNTSKEVESKVIKIREPSQLLATVYSDIKERKRLEMFNFPASFLKIVWNGKFFSNIFRKELDL